MGFDVNYNADSAVVKHGVCCRCSGFCENALVGVGQIPSGPGGALETVNRVILCVDCVALMDNSPKQFWYEGWPNQHRKSK